MIPIDNVKTHCQVAKRLSVIEIARKIYQSGGLANFYSGSSIVVIGCAPAHAIYFAMYEKAMKWLDCQPDRDFAKFAFVGAFSVIFHDLIMTPTEALKQRVQLLRSENAKISIK
jgi:solute carrier family 25 iron transporter 28/37